MECWFIYQQNRTDCYGNHSEVNVLLNGSTAQWDHFATLLKAGIAGVKQVSEDIKIMLHIENTDDREGLTYWVDQALANNVEFDVLGLSAYEKWQGPANRWAETLNLIANRYDQLSFSFVEYNSQARLLNDIMYNLPNNRGLGTFIWEPFLSGLGTVDV